MQINYYSILNTHVYLCVNKKKILCVCVCVCVCETTPSHATQQYGSAHIYYTKHTCRTFTSRCSQDARSVLSCSRMPFCLSYWLQNGRSVTYTHWFRNTYSDSYLPVEFLGNFLLSIFSSFLLIKCGLYFSKPSINFFLLLSGFSFHLVAFMAIRCACMCAIEGEKQIVNIGLPALSYHACTCISLNKAPYFLQQTLHPSLYALYMGLVFTQEWQLHQSTTYHVISQGLPYL